MSRTVKGSKPPGYEFWSPRPGNKGGGGRGKFAKVNTHRIERRNAKIELLKDLMLDDYQDECGETETTNQ